ncbi:antitoxin [Lacticaseibacillus jixiensis]|uniref:antitoxin n=1 Tax=Lacticaseibacillus jixiensis TaxID=3231926 RepID=UPI0036F2B153
MAQAEFLQVNMTEALRAKLDSYCRTCVTDPSDLIDTILAQFLDAQAQEAESLAAGYREMASLNTEICHEFTACESEAYDHIR